MATQDIPITAITCKFESEYTLPANERTLVVIVDGIGYEFAGSRAFERWFKKKYGEEQAFEFIPVVIKKTQ